MATFRAAIAVKSDQPIRLGDPLLNITLSAGMTTSEKR